LAVTSLTIVSNSYRALAQSIVPAANDTNTIVTPTGNRYNITGGKTSGDGSNLFHSFYQFNLNNGEIANFQSLPQIQNILGRVVGRNASYINGLIQVTGSKANLFLMNPAGIIFGPNASLNVAASFFATTASGIGFVPKALPGNVNWFQAIGDNNYPALVGNPNAFAFAMSQPGAIINSGNLSVGVGQNLMLLGGTVASTGKLNAPGGQITIAAVPGESLVRLSQPGYLLSLEISPLSFSSSVPLSPLSLPQLLTGGSGGNATGIIVNSQGQVELIGSGLRLENGDVLASNVNSNNATLAANRNLILVESQLQTTENLNLLAQDTVLVRDSVTKPFIAQAGANLLIQGNRGIDIFALHHPASGLFSLGDMVLRSANTVGGDAHYWIGGNFKIEQLDGKLGGLFSPYDPVITASGDVIFANYSGPSLHIIAGGSVTIPGTVRIIGTDAKFYTIQENVTLSDGTTIAIDGNAQPTLDIRAGVSKLGSPIIVGAPESFIIGDSTTTKLDGLRTSADITIGNIILPNQGGIVFLTTQYNPNTSLPGGAIRVNGSPVAIDISSASDNPNKIVNGSAIIIDSRSSIALNGVNSSASILSPNGGDVKLIAVSDITTNSINSQGINKGGNISITSYSGNIDTTGSTLNSSAINGQGGTISFTTNTGTINLKNINSSGTISSGDVSFFGSINLNSNLLIDTGLGNSNITFNSTIDGQGNLSLNAGNGTIQFNKSIGQTTPIGSLEIDKAANVFLPKDITTANGNITFKNSPVTLIDNTKLNAGTATITIGQGLTAGSNALTLIANEIDLNKSINGTSNLLIQPATPTQNIVLGGTDNLTQNLDLTADEINTLGNGFSKIAIGSGDGTGGITFENTVTFKSPLIVQNGLGTININGTIIGQENVPITINGKTQLSGEIRTAEQNITINGNILLGDNKATLSTSSPGIGNILVNGTIDSNYNLTLETGSGDIILNGAIGSIIPLGNLTINSTNNLITSAITAASINQITGNGTSTFNGELNTNTPQGINLNGNNINLNNNIITQNQGNLNINNSGLLKLADNIKLNLEGALNQSGTGQLLAAGNLNINNDINIKNPVVLTGNLNIISQQKAVNINIQNSIDSSNAGKENLSLTVNQGNINLGKIGSTTPIGNLTINSVNNLTTSSINAASITQKSGSGTSTFNGEINTNSPLGININGNNVQLNNRVITTNQGNLTINNTAQLQIAPNTKINLDGSFLQTGSGKVDLGGEITTNNQNISFNSPVNLTGEVTLNTGEKAGNITFNNPLDGQQNLSLTAGEGNINLLGATGSNTRLGNLIINSVNNLNTGSITAASISQKSGSGTSTFNGEIDTNTSQGINIIGNNVLFNNRVITTNQGNLTINNSGLLQIAPTAKINLDGSFLQTGNGVVQLAGDITTNNQNISFNSPVTLTGDTTLNTGNKAGDIIFNNTVDGNKNLSLKAGEGNVNSQLGIGDLVSLGSLTIETAKNVTTGRITTGDDSSNQGGGIRIFGQTIKAGNLDASGKSLGGEINLAADSIKIGQINSSSELGNGGSVTLFSKNDIDLNYVNAQGGSNGVGGRVEITAGGFFRANSTFTDRKNLDSSISTAGQSTGGEIIIRHGGGQTIPFIVGNAFKNGTKGAISTGSDAEGILPSLIPPPAISLTDTETLIPTPTQATGTRPTTQGIVGSFTEGNIQIITSEDIAKLDPRFNIADLQKPDRSLQLSSSNFAQTVTSNVDALRDNGQNLLKQGKIAEAFSAFDQADEEELQDYFGGKLKAKDQRGIAIEQLNKIARETGKKPALVRVLTKGDELTLILITPEDNSFFSQTIKIKREDLLKLVNDFRSDITDPDWRESNRYLKRAKELYQLIITPIEAELQKQKIDTLLFSLDTGLKFLPIAALHDGKQFLVEKYSLALIPSINFTDFSYQNLKNSSVLAMGSSKFISQDSLYAVPVELSSITQMWTGNKLTNEQFTVANLKRQREQRPFEIIHLATHAEFKSGESSNSYIQFWGNEQLKLNQLPDLGWKQQNPPVQLLVLSACRTALGVADDRQEIWHFGKKKTDNAELGFAGVAIASGAKSALASLWYVSDEGTLALMVEFYQQLKTAPIKAEALRQAQIAMIRGQVTMQDGKLRGALTNDINLPAELTGRENKDLTHPYYWAAFTMIGNPW